MDDQTLKKIREEVEAWAHDPQSALVAAIREYRDVRPYLHRPSVLTLKIRRGSGNADKVPGELDEDFRYWMQGLSGSLLNAIETYVSEGRSKPGMLVLMVSATDRWRSRYVPDREIG